MLHRILSIPAIFAGLALMMQAHAAAPSNEFLAKLLGRPASSGEYVRLFQSPV